MLAAQVGAHESITKLLALVPAIVDIEARDAKNNTALHWAVGHGHIEAVKCLLKDKKPSLLNSRGLNARGTMGAMKMTALNMAVWNGNGAMVNLLLEKNAKINVKSSLGTREGNALKFARLWRPELFNSILMKVATLSIEEQQNCLRDVTKRTYPNVLFFAAAERPSLFNELVNKIREQARATTQPNKELCNIIFRTKDQNGRTPLMLAAQLGAHKSIPKILNSDLNINIEERDGHQDTALHLAARYGHIEIY